MPTCRSRFSPRPRIRVSQELASVYIYIYIYICTCIYVRNLQSLEILLVAPWKMYDALLLKASKRKFQCLDISSYSTDSALWIHPRPSSFRNTVTSSNPHPIWRVDINVNRMSVHPQERRLCTTAYQRYSWFSLRFVRNLRYRKIFLFR